MVVIDCSNWSLSSLRAFKSSESSLACWALKLIWKLLWAKFSHSRLNSWISDCFLEMNYLDSLNIDSSRIRPLLISATLLLIFVNSSCWASNSNYRLPLLFVWSCFYWSWSLSVVSWIIYLSLCTTCTLRSSTNLLKSWSLYFMRVFWSFPLTWLNLLIGAFFETALIPSSFSIARNFLFLSAIP